MVHEYSVQILIDPKSLLNKPAKVSYYERQGCCFTGAQQPGAPKKGLWAPKVFVAAPKINYYLLGS